MLNIFIFRLYKESKAESSAAIISHLIFTDLGLWEYF